MSATTEYHDLAGDHHLRRDPDGARRRASRAFNQLGYTVTTFTGTSEAEWTSAMVGKQLLVIPELEISPLSPALDVTTKLFIASFVSRGGTLIVFAPRSGRRRKSDSAPARLFRFAP